MSPTGDLNRRMALLKAAAAGKLDELPCPECGRASVTVRFTNPARGEFRTWFLCRSCGLRFRAQASGRPPYFDRARLDPTLDREDQA